MLEIDNIEVSFGGVHALRAVTFTAEASHITSVVGPNGAGKTTLFNVVTGFQKPDAGKVVFEGHDLLGRRPSLIASNRVRSAASWPHPATSRSRWSGYVSRVWFNAG